MSDLTGEAESYRARKIALRGHLLTARRLLSPTARSEAAIKIQDQTRDLVRSVTPSTIAAYVPIGPEPGGVDLPAMLAGFAQVLLPVLLEDGDLEWAEYSGSLVTGPRGLRQPPGSGARLGVGAIRSADLVLVPALAVDRRGIRMGRGGGSYDRALSRLTDPPFRGAADALLPGAADALLPGAADPPLPGAGGRRLSGVRPRPLVLALLHEGELIDEVPAEPHDRPVHGVITPTGTFSLSRAFEWTK